MHLEASDVRKLAARGDETPIAVPEGSRGCTVEGRLFTGKVAGEFRINLGEDKPLELAPVCVYVCMCVFTRLGCKSRSMDGCLSCTTD